MADSPTPSRYSRSFSRTSRTSTNDSANTRDQATSSPQRLSSPIDEYHELNHKSQEDFAKAIKSEIKRKTRKVAVLLISWDKHTGHYLDTRQELRDLTTVFETKFKFFVQTSLLRAEGQPPRHQLQAILAEFLGAHDRPDTQIIIYYGGHGMISEDQTILQLLGSNPDEDNLFPMEINWNDVETSLYRLHADLLLIMDCCNAGFVARDSRQWPNSRAHFEFLGSTSFSDFARGPASTESFTRAMIEALHVFGDEKRFFTAKSLHHKITTTPRFRATKQEPVLSTCGKQNLHEEMRIMAMDEKMESEDSDSVSFYLHLKYVFTAKPSDADIKTVVDRLSDLVQNDRLPIKNFLWAGLSRNDPRMTLADAARLLVARLGHCSYESHSHEMLKLSASTEKPFDLPQRTLTTLSVDEDSSVSRSLKRTKSELVLHDEGDVDALPIEYEDVFHMFCDLFYRRLTAGLGSAFLSLCIAYSVVSFLHFLGFWLERLILKGST